MGITPLLSIGLPLVRILLRLQQPTASDLADSITDFDELLMAVEDKADRREISRSLEHISDRVMRRLDRFIQAEFRNADDGDVTAAANVVSRALMRAGAADLSAVVRHDVQVRALEQHTLAHSAFAAEAGVLGGYAERLAHALLRETCYEIVELARRHPNLTASALASLLSRSTELRELLDSVERSLNDLPSRIVATTLQDHRTDNQRAIDEFAVDYRRAVTNDYDKLELYGIDLIRDVRRYSLTTAYLSLRLAASSADGDQPAAGDISRMLPRHGLAILRGAAGAGKTTILQWLATNVARKTLDGGLAHLNEFVPFVVKLRNYADKPFPPIAGLAEATTRSTLLEEPAGWTAGIFRTGSVLLLVDGLDELSDQKQAELLNWLDGFTQFGRHILVVLTSRPTANATLRDVLRLRFSDTRVADVLPLDRDQIRSFVLHWHTAISSQFTGAERASIEGQAAKVAGVISSAREYRLLASSPLLCAVLCALFHLKRGMLPAHRIEIYDTLLNLLLGDRDAHKRVDVDNVRLSPTEKRLVLEDVADFFLTNELSESTDERVVEVIARSPLAHRFGESTPEDILKHFVARSGLLRAPTEGSVDFVHRTFLEYLAARSLVRHDRIEMLASKVLQANWNEAIVLAAGIGIERQVESLVHSVIARAEQAREHGHDRLLLTVTCAGFLDTALVLKDATRSRILQIVSDIVPPVDEAQARALASAGNSLLSLLRTALRGPRLSRQALHTSIRTLGEIGTAEALAVLGGIPADLRIDAIEELVSVWSWFDPQAFADVVLRGLAPLYPIAVTLPNSTLLPHINGLHENFLWECAVDVPEESFVDNCRNVRIGKLTVSNLHIVNDERARAGEFLWTIHGLRQLRATGLRTLRLTSDSDPQRSGTVHNMALSCRNGRLDSDVWPYLPGLEILELAGEIDVDFRGLGGSEVLSRLTIDGNVTSRVPAEFDLPGLKELRWADSADTNLLTSIVDSAPNLRSLAIRGVAGLTSLDFLSSAAALQEVDLADIEDLDDISTLLSLADLNRVHIRGVHSFEMSRSLELLASEVDDFMVDDISVHRFSWSDTDEGNGDPSTQRSLPLALASMDSDEEDEREALEDFDRQYGRDLYDLGEPEIEEMVCRAEIELEDSDLAAELEQSERGEDRPDQ